MRALVLTEPLAGTPPLLTDVPDPVPGYGQVLVRIHAGALNPRDLLLTCGGCEHCRIGKVIFCPALSVLGGPADGTLAELLAVPARNLHRAPAHLSLEQAAALPMALGTAYQSLFVAAGLQPGETVLIHGVGGGVAQIGAQLAVAAEMAAAVTFVAAHRITPVVDESVPLAKVNDAITVPREADTTASPSSTSTCPE